MRLTLLHPVFLWTLKKTCHSHQKNDLGHRLPRFSLNLSFEYGLVSLWAAQHKNEGDTDMQRVFRK